MNESERGQAKGYDDAYQEGYAAKYHGWLNRDNPYPEGTPQHDGFWDGYAEAVGFVC